MADLYSNKGCDHLQDEGRTLTHCSPGISVTSKTITAVLQGTFSFIIILYNHLKVHFVMLKKYF